MLYFRVVLLLLMSVSCFSKTVDIEDTLTSDRTLELYEAIENNSIEVVDWLIEQKADVNIGLCVDNEEYSFLQYAIEEKKPITIIQKLIIAGAKVSNKTLRLARKEYPEAYQTILTLLPTKTWLI